MTHIILSFDKNTFTITTNHGILLWSGSFLELHEAIDFFRAYCSNLPCSTRIDEQLEYNFYQDRKDRDLLFMQGVIC